MTDGRSLEQVQKITIFLCLNPANDHSREKTATDVSELNPPEMVTALQRDVDLWRERKREKEKKREAKKIDKRMRWERRRDEKEQEEKGRDEKEKIEQEKEEDMDMDKDEEIKVQK